MTHLLGGRPMVVMGVRLQLFRACAALVVCVAQRSASAQPAASAPVAAPSATDTPAVPAAGAPAPHPAAAPAYPAPYGYGPPPPRYYGAPPYRAPPSAQETERFSTPLMVTGIVLAGVGVTGLVVGSALTVSASGDREDIETNCVVACNEGDVDAYRTKTAAGKALLIAGAVGIAVGVPLVVIGARKVVAVDEQSARRRRPVAAVLARPGAVALRLSY